MAKPIEATPAISGEDARRFIRNMHKTQNREPNESELEIVRVIKSMNQGRKDAKNHIRETKDPWKCGCNICMSHLASVF
jgi:hypothetical protein